MIKRGGKVKKFKAYRFPFTWSDISLYRGELFGVAIISVIFHHYFHLFYNIEAPNKVIHIISKFYYNAIGSVGVDILFFCPDLGYTILSAANRSCLLTI